MQTNECKKHDLLLWKNVELNTYVKSLFDLKSNSFLFVEKLIDFQIFKL